VVRPEKKKSQSSLQSSSRTAFFDLNYDYCSTLDKKKGEMRRAFLPPLSPLLARACNPWSTSLRRLQYIIQAIFENGGEKMDPSSTKRSRVYYFFVWYSGHDTVACLFRFWTISLGWISETLGSLYFLLFRGFFFSLSRFEALGYQYWNWNDSLYRGGPESWSSDLYGFFTFQNRK
jgi:hypothetical protein